MSKFKNNFTKFLFYSDCNKQYDINRSLIKLHTFCYYLLIIILEPLEKDEVSISKRHKSIQNEILK